MEQYTTIEINGIATDVVIHYKNEFGMPVIIGMQDMNGNEIAPDLLGEADLSELKQAC